MTDYLTREDLVKELDEIIATMPKSPVRKRLKSLRDKADFKFEYPPALVKGLDELLRECSDGVTATEAAEALDFPRNQVSGLLRKWFLEDKLTRQIRRRKGVRGKSPFVYKLP